VECESCYREMLDDQVPIPGRGRQGIFFVFINESRPALGPTQLSVQQVPSSSRGGKADHPSLYSAEVKNAWSYTSTIPVRLHVVVLN